VIHLQTIGSISPKRLTLHHPIMHVSLFHWNHTIDLISAKLFLVYYGMRDKRNLRKMRFSDSRVIVAWINRGDEYIGLYESVGTGTNKALLSEDAPYIGLKSQHDCR